MPTPTIDSYTPPGSIGLDVGDAVQETVPEYTAFGTLPKWLGAEATSPLPPITYAIKGTAALPSGHRRATIWEPGTGRITRDYYVRPMYLDAMAGAWRATIWASNGSFIYADGLGGIPILGTPRVRLQDNAPARAMLTIPAQKGPGNVLAPTFAAWSDGHQEPIKRGMELTVEYRGPDGPGIAFRGQIYQVADGETIEVAAYDRMMDLYQFSGQYQNHQGRASGWYGKAGDDGTYYTYRTGVEIGVLVAIKARSILRIDPLSQMAYGQSRSGYFMQALPASAGYAPQAGGIITRIAARVGAMVNDAQFTNKITMRARAILYRRAGGTFTPVASTEWQSAEISGSGTAILAWSVNWTVTSDSMIGAEYRGDVTQGSYRRYGAATSLARTTVSEIYASEDGSTWTQATASDMVPELAVDFTWDRSVSTSAVTKSGDTVQMPISETPDPADTYLSTIDRGPQAYLEYFVVDAMDVATIAQDLISAAGLKPYTDALDLGNTTFYQSSTFDYLDLLQELITGSEYAMAASIAEPGSIDIQPRHTTAEEPARVLTTAPAGDGERIIVAHDLTQHWAAEKATVAYISENATQSGLPLALETDDIIMGGEDSQAGSLQSPLRGVTADGTLGTHAIMAIAAANKIRMLHTNTLDGSITVAGYHADLWDVSGRPIELTLPEYGISSTKLIPTALELGDGTTKIIFDNVPTTERSELARSMGKANDGISNAVRSYPASVYIFARFFYVGSAAVAPTAVSAVACIREDGTSFSQSTAAYIKTVTDRAGYAHVCAVFDASPAGYAASTPIVAVSFTNNGTTYTAPLDNPVYALGGQRVHVDIRMPAFPSP